MNILKSLRATALATVAALTASVASAAPASPLQHIFYIMMENHGFSEIIGNTADAPFINQLAAQGAVATQYFGVTHPSLPNYLAGMTGDFQGIWDDCQAGPTVTCAPEEFVPGSGDGTDGNYLTPAEIASSSAQVHWFSGQTLVDQLVAAHKTWRAYFEDMPAGGYNVVDAPVVHGTTVNLYAQKHNPFLYMSNIRNTPSELSNIVPLGYNFTAALASGRVPSFVYIVPNQCHDMHGISGSTALLIGLPQCGYPASGLDHGAIQLGDDYLRNLVGTIEHSTAWTNERSAIVIVWDEDDYAGFAGCCSSPTGVGGVVLGGANAPMLVVTSPSAGGPAPGTQFTTQANHYSLLATIETMWNLPCLANACNIPVGGLMTSMFKAQP